MHKFVVNPAHQFARIESDGDAVATFFVTPTKERGEAMAMGLDVVTHIQRFRELRLHHYRAVLQLRAYGDNEDIKPRDREHYHKRADVHMTFVQTLNILFPIGDNVEGDLYDGF